MVVQGNSMSKQEAPFEEHLEELFRRMRICISSIIVCSIACLPFSPMIVEYLRTTLVPDNVKLMVLDPFEAVISFIEISFMLGIVISMPLIIYHTIKFVSPGLYEHEKRLVYRVIAIGSLLFVAGTLVCAYVVLPMLYRFCYDIAGGSVTLFFSLRNLIEYTIAMMIGFGLAFQMPLAVAFLIMTNVLSVEVLTKNRAVAYILLALVSVLFLTPETTTLADLLVTIILIVLYELGIILSKALKR